MIHYTQYESKEGYIGDIWFDPHHKPTGRYIGRLINTSEVIDYEAENKAEVVYAMERSIEAWKESAYRHGFEIPTPGDVEREGFMELQQSIRKLRRKKLPLDQLEIAIVELMKEKIDYED